MSCWIELEKKVPLEFVFSFGSFLSVSLTSVPVSAPKANENKREYNLSFAPYLRRSSSSSCYSAVSLCHSRQHRRRRPPPPHSPQQRKVTLSFFSRLVFFLNSSPYSNTQFQCNAHQLQCIIKFTLHTMCFQWQFAIPCKPVLSLPFLLLWAMLMLLMARSQDASVIFNLKTRTA